MQGAGRAKDGFSPRVFKGAGPANTITLDFWPPETWKNNVPVASYRGIRYYGITTNHPLVLQKTGFMFQIFILLVSMSKGHLLCMLNLEVISPVLIFLQFLEHWFPLVSSHYK